MEPPQTHRLRPITIPTNSHWSSNSCAESELSPLSGSATRIAAKGGGEALEDGVEGEALAAGETLGDEGRTQGGVGVISAGGAVLVAV